MEYNVFEIDTLKISSKTNEGSTKELQSMRIWLIIICHGNPFLHINTIYPFG